MKHTSSSSSSAALRESTGQGHAMPTVHSHESMASAMAHKEGPHGSGTMPPRGHVSIAGKQFMPHAVAANDPQRFFARVGENPLGEAFEGKITVHPGMGGVPVREQERDALADKLADMPCDGRKLAYIHVPFCETHCLYCSFYQSPYRRESCSAYTDALVRELRLWSDRAAQGGGPVHAVYLGGGTPTALPPEDLDRLLAAVRAYLPLANDCEITVEGRASNLTPQLIEAALGNGVNRFSLGVQTFNTGVRQAMGRHLEQEALIERIRLLQSCDQASVIIDLIYGLPGQSMSVWLEDLHIARSLELDGMDCYQLGVHKGSPLAKAIADGRIEPAADCPQMGKMFEASVRTLESSFYRRLSVNHWGRTPRERNIYNLFSKGGASCLGFGPGAGGNLSGHMTFNFKDLTRWTDTVYAGRKPVGMLLAPVRLAALNKALTEGLEQGRLELAPLEALCAERGYEGLAAQGELRALVSPLLDQWREAGLLEPCGQSFILTVAGQFWYVNLTQLLIEYIETQLAVAA